MNPKQRVEYLTNILNEANYNYYVLSESKITDQEYDSFLRELITLEEKYPELKSESSPTMRVGGEVVSKFNRISHKIPMLSLSNVFNEEEIFDFINKGYLGSLTDFSKNYSISPLGESSSVS